ncbi:hypothetical protein CcCBS67573_g01104 [Chytriomyces confervae]|uniref:Uncharacterized protein n=1 Tax=Chytriomyces confervae TaxID=246404 RepID=A0A507FQM4_9FUNG|nr:hypothetical protein HDU80_007532 [Chytriomyces hyalinus]TPX77626.1 hypothetical protein CcCBS67573_g01104 [Chytriomyces confervae]
MSTLATESRLPTPPPSNMTNSIPMPLSKPKAKGLVIPSLTTRQKSRKQLSAAPNTVSDSSSIRNSHALSNSFSIELKPPRSISAAAASPLSPPPSLKTGRSKSSAPVMTPSLSLTPAAMKRRNNDIANAAFEKDALILALTEQVVSLEAKLQRVEEKKLSPKEIPPALVIAQLNAKLNARSMTVENLEQRLHAFSSKQVAIETLKAEIEDLELWFDEMVADKDMTIETMRRQIQIQTMGLFAEVSKSRDLLVDQSMAHAGDLSRLNAMIASQAAEMSKIREELRHAHLQNHS